MGTNFYAKINICPTCGKEGHENQIHLGKSSMGWKFNLQLNDRKYYQSWEEMKEFLRDKEIQDEYGRIIPFSEFVEWVENKKDVDESWYWNDPKNRNCRDDSIDIDGYKFTNHEFS